MTHQYAVVHFKDGKTYSDIPTHWILPGNTSCWWPEGKNIASLILRKVIPNENGQWKKYDIEVIGFYASLEAARKKATDSDCSSDDGDMGKRLRRKKRSMKMQSDTDESEEDTIDYRERTPPPSLSFKCRRETTKINIFGNSAKENMSTKSKTDNYLSSTSRSEESQIEEDNTLVAGICDPPAIELVEEKIDKLTIMVKKNLIYVKGIEERLSKAEMLDNNLNVNIDVVMEKLLLVSKQGIMELDMSINEDKDLRERFTNYLKNIGGRNPKEMVSRILTKLLKNSLGVQCSLLGKRNHIRFKYSTVMEVIITAVRHNFNASSESEIELLVEEWLRLSKLRMSREK